MRGTIYVIFHRTLTIAPIFFKIRRNHSVTKFFIIILYCKQGYKILVFSTKPGVWPVFGKKVLPSRTISPNKLILIVQSSFFK
jgi:hypothetical protein